MITTYPQILNVPLDGNSNGFVLGSTDTKAAWIFNVPKSGTLSKIGITIATLTTSALLRVSFQTVSGGLPTGTYYGSSAQATFTPAANTATTVTLGTPATATQGDPVALVLEWDSTVGSLDLAAFQGVSYVAAGEYPYPAYYTSGAWAQGSTQYCFSFFAGYSDGTWADIGTMPSLSMTDLTFQQNLSGNPDEVGIRIIMPFKCKVDGFWLDNTYAGSFGSAEGTMCLYDSDGVTLLASAGTKKGSNTGGAVRFVTLTAPLTLQQGMTYTLTYKAGSTSSLYLYYATYGSADAAAAGIDGSFPAVSRNGGGPWTTTSTTRYFLGLRVSAILPWAVPGGSFAF